MRCSEGLFGGKRVVRREVSLLLLLTFVATGTPAVAEEITFAFKGVKFFDGLSFDGSSAMGTEIAGTYTFDSLAVDQEPNSPRSGDYPLLDLFFTSGAASGRLFGQVQTSIGTGISVADDALAREGGRIDSYRVRDQEMIGPEVVAGLPRIAFFFDLVDSTATAFSSDALPLTPPSLGDFDPFDPSDPFSKRVRVVFNAEDGSGRWVDFELTSLIPLLRGDENLDGSVDVRDAILLLLDIVETQPRSGNSCADVDGDGEVNIVDVVRIQRAIVGFEAFQWCDPDECAGFARFADRGSTVFDCHTRLEWEKKLPQEDILCASAPADVRCVENRYFGNSWPQAGPRIADFLAGLDGFAGIPTCTSPSDCTSQDGVAVTCETPPPDDCWRIPEIDELRTIRDTSVPGCGESISDRGCTDPVFGPTKARFHYTVTSAAENPGSIWRLPFGNLGSAVRDSEVTGGHVRAVRSSR